jgi:general secretion pathway protein G
MKKAFTMIELVFVIVVLGILAAIAVPKFAVSRSDAEIAKGRADVSTIRSAIITERQAQFISGTTTYIPKLSTSTTTLFTGNGTRELLMYGIAAGTTSGHWKSTNDDGKHYSYMVGTSSVAFTYDSSTGKFTCDESKQLCKDLVN